MAMTKKEREEMERLLTIAALRYTVEVAPDIEPPESWSEVRNGYAYNESSLNVAPACTSTGSHCMYQHDKTTSHGPRRLYSTQLLALKALRNAVERESAYRLRRVDRMIAQEEMANAQTQTS